MMRHIPSIFAFLRAAMPVDGMVPPAEAGKLLGQQVQHFEKIAAERLTMINTLHEQTVRVANALAVVRRSKAKGC